MTTAFSVEEIVEPDCIRLRVAGEADMAAEGALARAIDDAAARLPVVVELADVTFMDSSGLKVLILARNCHGERVTVGSLSDNVKRVVDVAGVAHVLGL